MALIKFSYDIERDLRNYKNSYFEFNYPTYGRQDIQSKVAGYLFPSFRRALEEIDGTEEKIDFARKYLEKYKNRKEDFISSQQKALSEYWETIESDYIKALEKYFGVKIDFKEVNAYFTTLSIAPYNASEKSFMICMYEGLSGQIVTILHEFMHLVFRANYEKYCAEKGLSYQSILEITEALIILLNYEFIDFLPIPSGNRKPTTKDLQEEIVKMWNEKKGFKEILERLIDLRQ
jgi:hypothetical protein